MTHTSTSRKCLLFLGISLVVLLQISISFSAEIGIATSSKISFEERLDAQQAIEKVWYRHRLWPSDNKGKKPDFNAAMSLDRLTRKVKIACLEMSLLERYFGISLEGEQIQAELERMIRTSHDRKLLDELFRSLNDDPMLIAECLVRPRLSHQLCLEHYYADPQIHAAAWVRAEQLRTRVSTQELSAANGVPLIPVTLRVESADSHDQRTDISCTQEFFDSQAAYFPVEKGSWSRVINYNDSLIILRTDERSERSLVGKMIRVEKDSYAEWLRKQRSKGNQIEIPVITFKYMLENQKGSSKGTEFIPGNWQPLWYFPEARVDHSAVWTGTEMIVWGGFNAGELNTGGRYNPVLNSWEQISTELAPSPRRYHSTVWTGEEMIIWGGRFTSENMNDGARYNPLTDSWQAVTTIGAPSARSYHTAVWTGEEMIVWGGESGGFGTQTGMVYRPRFDSWFAMTSSGAPVGRIEHTAVWTGEEMLVWGGSADGFLQNTGGRYSLSSDTWYTIETSNAPTARQGHTMVWTGETMLVWGGKGFGFGNYLNDGSIYRPSLDTGMGMSWTMIPTGNAPSGRYEHTAVWTGSEMIVWGGSTPMHTDTGGHYNPSTWTWIQTPGASAPLARYFHTAIWTGETMIVWGGLGGTYHSTGGRYDPVAKSWSSTTSSTISELRMNYSTVWTGVEMMIWGGYGLTYLSSGSKYYPVFDIWQETNPAGSIAPRHNHTAVWTGTDVLIWGGYGCADPPGCSSNAYLASGAQFDPDEDYPAGFPWLVMDPSNAPEGREHHTAVWTSDEMIVWGGSSLMSSELNSGGRYDPAGSSPLWTTMDTSTAPVGRWGHRAVWADSTMVVWGGTAMMSYDLDNGRYYPSTDSWASVSVSGQPHGRIGHTALWTGGEMLIWGGMYNEYKSRMDMFPSDGGRYNPFIDSWTAMATETAPTARANHSTVWDGRSMIVFGGYDYESGYFQSGGLYDPLTDAGGQSCWTETPLDGAPSARSDHPAVWTGEGMIVWDGSNGTQNGGIFYPNTSPRSIPLVITGTSTWDPTFEAPFCDETGHVCDSGDLLIGRGAGLGPEPNYPNTLYSSCADGTDGLFHHDESIDRIRLYTNDTEVFQEGSDVTIEVTIWAFADYESDILDLYYTADAATPVWTQVDSLVARSADENVLVFAHTLSAGTQQAFRAVLRRGGSESSCGSGVYTDHDDLVFTVADDSAYPRFVLGSGSSIVLDGSSSTDGSNLSSFVSFPGHDAFDSVAAYEWDLTGSANLQSICDSASSGIDLTGETVTVSESVFQNLGVARPGDHPLWLRVTDKAGERQCASSTLTIIDGRPPTVTIVTPNGGESWAYSDSETNRRSHLIVWASADNFHVDRTTLRYTTDAGAHWSDIVTFDFQPSFDATDTPLAIPDDDTGGVLSSIAIGEDQIVDRVRLKLSINHTRLSDLTLTLIGPDSTEVILSNGLGGDGDNYSGTVFDDESLVAIASGKAPFTGSYRPVQPLSAFTGKSTAGTWRLKVVDGAADVTGSIKSWRLDFTYVNQTNYLWSMPTQAEATAAGQRFPSAECQIQAEVWDESENHTTDASDGNFYIIQPTTTAVKTLILWDSSRIETAYGPAARDALALKLQELADHNKISGYVRDLATVPPVAAAYAAWDDCHDGDGCDPADPLERANAVATEIRTYLQDQVISTFTSVSFAIFVGDDSQIPFYRMIDQTSIYPESKYTDSGAIDDSTRTGIALAADNFLTDNFYTEFAPEESGLGGDGFVYHNDIALGRLVETPTEMMTLINTFLAADGQVTVTSPSDDILVTGFDFLYDSAFEIAAVFQNAGKTVDCLLDDPTRSESTNPCDDQPYTPAHLLGQVLTNPPHRLMNINTHANHYSWATSDGVPAALTTDDLEGSAIDGEGSIIYTSGCHSGLSISEEGTEPHPLDLPQEIARKRILAYIGNTGFGWGMYYGRGLTEKLMEFITDEILSYDSIAIGTALAQAKREYYLHEKRWDVFDEKVMHELTLYGIPNTLIVTRNARSENNESLPGPGTTKNACVQGICLSSTLASSQNKGSLPSGVTELELNFTYGSGTYSKITTPTGDYYRLNGQSSSEVGDAIQPQFVYDSYLSGTESHGVIMTGGAYTIEEPFTPVIAVPQSTNDYEGVGQLPLKSAFTPLMQASYSGTDSAVKSSDNNHYTTMIVHTGYYDKDTTTQYLFNDMQFVIYYSNSSDHTGPSITNPGGSGFHTLNGQVALFSVEATDASGVFRVLVTYDDSRTDSWHSVDLVYNGITHRWEGQLSLKGSIIYYVQAIDNAGNIGMLSDSGPDLDGAGNPYGSDWEGPETWAITLLDTDSDGMPDAYENLHTCLNVIVGDEDSDPDHDYLDNEQEFSLNTDPCSGDSDGGGDNDGSEVNNGRDPAAKGDDKQISIGVARVDSTYTIDWDDSRGENSIIDGYYYVYRSDTPFFDPLDLIVGDVPDGLTTHDDVGPPCDPCFYRVWNVALNMQPPVIASIIPDSGPAAGNTTIEIYGKNFVSDATVTFCGVPATSVSVINASYLTCRTPAHAAGDCDVTVTNPNGQDGTMDNGFTYF